MRWMLKRTRSTFNTAFMEIMVTFQTTQKGPLGESDLILAGFAKLDFVNRVEFQRAQHVVVTEMLIFHIEPIASSSLPLASLLSLSLLLWRLSWNGFRNL